MANDPAFLFYPGDYLRDTQCLSEKSQVAYDRIMCEHMRNICITQEQLNFFIKRLSEDEKKEVFMLLTKVKGGFQIKWVAESICKRRSYSESRSNNRKGKHKNISKSYDEHMEIENEIENTNEISFGKSENLLKSGNGNFADLTKIEISNSIEYLDRVAQKKLSQDELKSYFEAFKLQYSTEFYHGRTKVIQHFRDWLKKQKNGSSTITAGNSTPKLGTSEARIAALKAWGSTGTGSGL